MSHTKHPHDEQKERKSDGSEQTSYWRRAHRSVTFWIAVSMMLTAMVVYVLTLDLSLRPTVQIDPTTQQPAP